MFHDISKRLWVESRGAGLTLERGSGQEKRRELLFVGGLLGEEFERGLASWNLLVEGGMGSCYCSNFG